MAMNTVFLHLSEEAIKRLQFPVRKAKGGRQKGEEDGVEYQRKLREEW